MRVSISTIWLVAAAAVLGGCRNEIRVEDDLTFSLFEYRLHTPYVEGVSVAITVAREDGGVDGWSLRSSDETVMTVERSYALDEGVFKTNCHAGGTGRTELEVLDAEGHVRASRTVDVHRPERVDLYPAGLQRVRRDVDVPAHDCDEPILVLAGGTATFEAAYCAGGERLYGNGVLLPAGDAGALGASDKTTYLFQRREYLQLSPAQTGAYLLGLAADRRPEYALARVPAEVVDESAIAEVRIEAEQTYGAQDGETFYLLARAFDERGREIYGVDFEWTIGGQAQTLKGDLLDYAYGEGMHADVEAAAGDASDGKEIAMRSGQVTSSNLIGCSTAAGRASLLAALATAALALARRRAY
ncbi:MAG: hypothetical protein JXR96_21750 [Deltaproteobacteria bacterium]|nr:hypothetical protein [Deltaproteobacteria bacterium]